MSAKPAYDADRPSQDGPLSHTRGTDGVGAAPLLTTERLTLRRLDARDRDAFLAYSTGPRTAFTGGPSKPFRAVEKFAAMIGQWTLMGYGRYAICLDADAPAIGHVGPLHYDTAQPAEMTWTLWDDAHTGQGYATEAAARVLAHLFDDLGWPGIVARIEPDNAASHAVALRLGGTRDDAAQAPAWMPNAVTYRFGCVA